MITTIEELEAQTPSQRAQFALDALKEAEKSELFEVNMSHYHCFNYNKCFACLGGLAAVKAIQGDFKRPFKVSTQSELKNVLDSDFEVGFIINFEDCLNSFRLGYIGSYFAQMGIDSSHGDRFNQVVPDYHTNPDRFKLVLNDIVRQMRERGY
jgi:hypothetical protein